MKIRVKFVKQGNLRFIGHLDILRYFQKVMRRADIPVRYSEGFNPHQIMSFASPLSVGMMSRSEYMDIDADFTGSGEELVRAINRVGVPELRALTAGKLRDGAKNAMSATVAAAFTVWLKEGSAAALGISDEAAFWDKVREFGSAPSIPFTKETRKGKKETDLAPLVHEIRVVTGGFGEENPYPRLYLLCSSGNQENVKPDQLLTAYFRARGEEYPRFLFQTEREELYADEGDGEMHDFRPLYSYTEPLFENRAGDPAIEGTAEEEAPEPADDPAAVHSGGEKAHE